MMMFVTKIATKTRMYLFLYLCACPRILISKTTPKLSYSHIQMKIKAIPGLELNPIHYFDLLKVEVYAQLSEGHMFIASNGGNGNQGQKGTDGKNGTDRIDSVW